MKFGEKLRQEREKAQISQADLAGKLGISRNTIVNYERGASHPNKREIYFQLANHFNVDVNYFLTEDEEFLITVAAKYGKRGASKAEVILDQAAALFAGGELSEADQIAFLHDMQRLFLDSKDKARKKFTPKKYRKPSSDD